MARPCERDGEAMTRVGIMQGRLLPPFEGRFQAFPATDWRKEFPLAQQAGLACIEWIYEQPHAAANPLGSDDGIAEMAALSRQTGIGVWSICADYYMTSPLVGEDGTVRSEVVAHLEWLIGRAGRLGARYMVLPFVDASSLRSPAAQDALPQALRRVLPAAEAAGVELHLETDLPPDRFTAVLRSADHPLVKANYDIGNSASLSYEPHEELTALAPWLGSVHVKDRVRGGGTVPLGTGNADFATCFERIRAAGFDRWFILQAARAAAGNEAVDEVELARRNRGFVEQQVARAVP